MIYKHTIPNNKIIPNLNKPKIFVPTNYLHILNKNTDKNTQKYKRQQNVQKLGGCKKFGGWLNPCGQ
jgi:hypothetical protein